MPEILLPPLPPGPHPTSDELYRAQHGPRGSEAERVLAHAASCAWCSEELARLEAFDQPEELTSKELAAAWARFESRPARPEEAPAAAPEMAPVVPFRPRRNRTWLALAASLAVAAVGLSVWLATRPVAPDGEVVRGGTPLPRQAAAWAPNGTLAEAPREFQFPPAPNGQAQQVMVFDAERRYQWTSPLASEGRVSFPEAERAQLQPGTTYFWTVLGGGQEAAARSFEVAPR